MDDRHVNRDDLEIRIGELRKKLKETEKYGTLLGMGALGALLIPGLGSVLGVSLSAISASALSQRLAIKRELERELHELEEVVETRSQGGGTFG